MSQRCLAFDSDVGKKSLELPSSDIPTANPAKNIIRVPSGIGLHLNSLGSFKAGNVNFKTKIEPGKPVVASPAYSNASERLFPVLENTNEADNHEQDDDTDNHEKRVVVSKCVQSVYSSGLEEYSFDVDKKPGKKRLLLDDEDDKNEVKPRKRRRSGSYDPNCKRCSCKKSKCLKLYCECFAGGTYCTDTCGCRTCSNKAEYEEIVNETRQQIQSRNPLAFIPRVVSTTIPTYTEKPEPSSGPSKHKRGCNCKKSLCLKKYCECFQSEVGCSVSCRCIGCKNTFGAKQGSPANEQVSTEDNPPDELDEALVATPCSNASRAICTLATEDDSPVKFQEPTCSKSASNFKDGISPEFCGSRTTTPEPACQRQLRSRKMTITNTVSSSSKNPTHLNHHRNPRTLPPGLHSLQSKAVGDSGEDEDGLPDFLLDPTEVQSATPTVTSSPKKKRITPPQVAQEGSRSNLPPVLRNGRKLTLQSLPSLPPVTSIREKLRSTKS